MKQKSSPSAYPLGRREFLASTAALLLTGGRAAPQPPPPREPRARAVIQIWMWGGPPHLDTFDPKPAAGSDFHGPYDKPLETNVPGIRIGQLLPQLARQADKYSLVRSVTHGNNGHETASYLMLTGHRPEPGVLRPGLGAIVSRFRGYDAGYADLIPPYIVLTDSPGRFSEEGFLGPRYKPFVTGGDPNRTPFLVEGIIQAAIAEQRQHGRRELRRSLDTFGRAIPGHPLLAAFDQRDERAYDLILGEARQLFDLSKEPPALRDAYGRHWFGQACLMARRLVEHGVPYVTLNYRGWDTHRQHFQAMNRNLPMLDQGLATLLRDLADRGRLDTTIVWWGGEFGRTPRIDWAPAWNGGRHHHGRCFSHLLAGGGFRGGQVIGATDATGERVEVRPVYPPDLLGSILELLGIDPDGPLPNPRGLDLKVMATSFGADGGRLKEIVSG